MGRDDGQEATRATRARVLENLRVGAVGLARVMQAATEAYIASNDDLRRRGGALYDEANDLYGRVNRLYDDIENDKQTVWKG
ncbi:hypothetical protein GCM10027059_02060 [Myceligenerans halotolerans]